MVKELAIGVIGIQGAVSEHVNCVKRIFREDNITNGKCFVIRTKEEIRDIDALILPGGETTTISRVLYKSGMYKEISKRLMGKNLPIMGTCAGCVLLANKLINDTKDVKLLGAMDMAVERNAFGRQRESFEQIIEIPDFSEPYNAVFIRAPIIRKVGKNCEVLAKIDKKIVMARQNNILALSFHPELTNDLRIHRFFLDMF